MTSHKHTTILIYITKRVAILLLFGNFVTTRFVIKWQNVKKNHRYV